MFVDFDYYQSVYGGSELTEDDFIKYSKKSERAIDVMMGNKILYSQLDNYPQKIIEILKDAICENAEFLSNTEEVSDIQNLSSYSINGVSMSFSSEKTGNISIKSSIYSELVSVGLISRIM